jgi:hypothetical protein
VGYAIRLDRLPYYLEDDRWARDDFTSNFPIALDRPSAAFPHLCFVFVPQGMLTHVGVVLHKGPGNSTFTYKLHVMHVSSVGQPVPLSQLRVKLHKTHHDTVDKALKRGSGTLTEAADNNMIVALKALRPKFSDRLDWLGNVAIRRVTSPAADQWTLGRDAIRASLRIGGFSTERLDQWGVPSNIEDSALAGIKPTDYEVDLIDHDSRAFPGWAPQPSLRVGVRVFSDGKRRMEITSVNAVPQEGRLGVDLIYYHRQSRSLILVQYKRLVDNKEVLVDDRLRKQLDRMDPLQHLQREPEHHADWRLGQDYCFLKLCRTNTESRVIEPNNMELLPGLYLPHSFLRLLLNDERLQGPNGGVYLGYERIDRHIDNTIFLQLAKEGWIGSSGIDIETIGKIANKSLANGHEVIHAIDHSAETPKQRQQRNRYKGPRRHERHSNA